MAVTIHKYFLHFVIFLENKILYLHFSTILPKCFQVENTCIYLMAGLFIVFNGWANMEARLKGKIRVKFCQKTLKKTNWICCCWHCHGVIVKAVSSKLNCWWPTSKDLYQRSLRVFIEVMLSLKKLNEFQTKRNIKISCGFFEIIKCSQKISSVLTQKTENITNSSTKAFLEVPLIQPLRNFIIQQYPFPWLDFYQ